MFGLILIGIIIFAIHQHRRHRALRWRHRYWRDDAWRKHVDQAEHYANELQKKVTEGLKEHASRHGWEFERKMADKFERQAERFERKMKKKFDKQTDRWGGETVDPATEIPSPQLQDEKERQMYQRARKRAAAQAGFYVHLMWYGVVIGFLFFINMLTAPSVQWWIFPAIGWGFGLASHFAAVFGWRWIHERVFEPAIQREVQREVTREKEVLRTEKQASLDELTATFAHEIRNPIAAAKSLVQQMGEDPTSAENVEYAKVALDELARVERSVSHLLKYAKEEDYNFDNVNLAGVLDGALTQMRAKLESNSVKVLRSYLTGPTVRADADKLRQVFSNMIDNATDSMANVTSERCIEVAIQRGRGGMATVRIRDNGCGIPEDKLSKIFNPFYTSKENGTGLGLGVAKKVIDSHRGTIEVSSHVGAGTEFVVSIPLADAARETAATQEDSRATHDLGVGDDGDQMPAMVAAAADSHRGQQ